MQCMELVHYLSTDSIHAVYGVQFVRVLFVLLFRNVCTVLEICTTYTKCLQVKANVLNI